MTVNGLPTHWHDIQRSFQFCMHPLFTVWLAMIERLVRRLIYSEAKYT